MGRLARTCGRLALVLLLACAGPEARRALTFERVEDAVGRGRSDEAEALLRAALRRDPRDEAAALRLASLLAEQGAWWPARQVLEALPGDVAESPSRRRARVRVLVETGDVRRATRLLGGLEGQGQADPETVARLLEELVSAPGSWDASLPAAWERELAVRWLRQGSLEPARQALARLPPEDPQRAQLALLLLRRALADDDTTLLGSLVASDLVPASPWRLLAEHRLLLEDGRTGEAVALEERFLAAHADHPGAYELLLTRARRETRGGRPEAALEHATRAAALAPEKADALVEQGAALLSLGRLEAARKALRLALVSEPGHRPARRLLEELSWPDQARVTLRMERAGDTG